MYAYLLEADAWTGAAVETLRLATHTIVTSPRDTPPDTIYAGRISDAGSISRSLASGGGLGRASVSYGFLELSAADGAYDPWLDYGFDGRPFVLRRLMQKGLPVGAAPVLFRGTLAGMDSSDATRVLRLKVRDRLAELAVPLLTERYAGTTVAGVVSASPTASDLAEGDTDLKGQLKGGIWGRVTSVPGKWANKFNLLVQFCANPVTSITVYDGGAPLTYRGDYPVISSLLNATLVPGEYATCLAKGIARLGGSPAFTVTADVVEGATLADRSAARVAARMLDALGIAATDRDAASFDAAHAFNPAEVGIFLDGDTTGVEAIGQALDSIGAALVPSAQGVFQAIGLDEPGGAPAGTLTERDLVQGGSTALGVSPGQENESVPAWSVEVAYGRVYQTLTAGQVAGSLDLDRKTYLAEGSRKATTQDSSVKARHPLATELKVDSVLVNAADAQAEAARRLALYSVRRDRLSWPVSIDRAPYDLGQVVTVDVRRFGYAGGKPFRVIGREDDFSKRLATLTLWG